MTAAHGAERDAILNLDPHQLTCLSHELRSPLTRVLGWAELLGQLDPPLPAGPARLVAAIQRGARGQARLLDNLALLADLHSHQVPRVREPVALAVLLAELPDTLATELEEARVGLQVAPVADALATTGDQRRLRQALHEVVRNGVQASHAGGIVNVTTSTALAGRRRATVALEIADTGPGIPADELPGITAPFARTRLARHEHAPGAGLGLAVADGVVRAHGGTLIITSTHGAGTRVRITLPAT